MSKILTGKITKGSLNMTSNTDYNTRIDNLMVKDFNAFVAALRSEQNPLFTTQHTNDTITVYRDNTRIAVVDKLLKNKLIDFINTFRPLLGDK